MSNILFGALLFLTTSATAGDLTADTRIDTGETAVAIDDLDVCLDEVSDLEEELEEVTEERDLLQAKLDLIELLVNEANNSNPNARVSGLNGPGLGSIIGGMFGHEELGQ